MGGGGGGGGGEGGSSEPPPEPPLDPPLQLKVDTSIRGVIFTKFQLQIHNVFRYVLNFPRVCIFWPILL